MGCSIPRDAGRRGSARQARQLAKFRLGPVKTQPLQGEERNMKIYDWHIAPNPRRLHIYLAEKGIKVELVEVGQEDLSLAPWFRRNIRTPWCQCWNWTTA